MDIRQNGPALFATVKQVRDLLEESNVPSESRHDAGSEHNSGRRDRDPGSRAG